VQSALNLITLISPNKSAGEFNIFVNNDERYKIRGGNQSIPDHLAAMYDSWLLAN
jgi:hypothetical protein